MQGYIIAIHRVRDEDLIVHILTEQSLMTLYRFYGARHSTINLGYKIDFEPQSTLKSSLSHLRDVYHLGFSWMKEHERLLLWQQFCALFNPHLRDSTHLESFYFKLLDDAALRWGKQNPKRVAIEAYIALLSFEGRLHVELECLLCEEAIYEDISLIRAYLPTHKNCSHRLSISKEGFDELMIHHTTLFLNDKEVDSLWITLLEGL